MLLFEKGRSLKEPDQHYYTTFCTQRKNDYYGCMKPKFSKYHPSQTKIKPDSNCSKKGKMCVCVHTCVQLLLNVFYHTYYYYYYYKYTGWTKFFVAPNMKENFHFFHQTRVVSQHWASFSSWKKHQEEITNTNWLVQHFNSKKHVGFYFVLKNGATKTKVRPFLQFLKLLLFQKVKLCQSMFTPKIMMIESLMMKMK